LALSIHSIESTQAFLFYLMQYSISNLNSFIILISIGYFIYYYVNNNKEDYKKLQDRNNSPIQLISQIKGLYFINPVLSLSLCITLFSFVGVPPLLGFFGKQMILSAALSNGYIFMSLIAILTSVISAVYYLAVIKQIYFDSSDYKINTVLYNNSEPKLFTTLINNNFNEKKVNFTTKNIVLSSSLTTIISLLTLIILLFIIIPQE
jgi:NADH-ubiquinone oxidoreductase chain 2